MTRQILLGGWLAMVLGGPVWAQDSIEQEIARLEPAVSDLEPGRRRLFFQLQQVGRIRAY